MWFGSIHSCIDLRKRCLACALGTRPLGEFDVIANGEVLVRFANRLTFVLCILRTSVPINDWGKITSSEVIGLHLGYKRSCWADV